MAKRDKIGAVVVFAICALMIVFDVPGEGPVSRLQRAIELSFLLTLAIIGSAMIWRTIKDRS